MLTKLEIKDFALIDHLELTIDEGLNILTGETGAGKSIIIKSLGLLCGGRATSEAVRQGADCTSIAASFELSPTAKIITRLTELGIPFSVEGKQVALIIRRMVSSKGRSSAWLNDFPVTVGTLAEIGTSLLDVFGQHENHRLLDPIQHTPILDCFLSSENIVDTYHKQWTSLAAGISELRKFIENAERDARDIDYLEFRLNELSEFGPEKGEYKDLKNKVEQARESNSRLEKLGRCQSAVDEGYEGESLSRALWLVSKELGADRSKDLSSLARDAEALAEGVDGLSYQLGKSLGSVLSQSTDVALIEDRLAGYHELTRKHQCEDPDLLVDLLGSMEQKLKFLKEIGEQVEKKLEQLVKESETLKAAASKLSKARKDAAKAVSRSVQSELADLGMKVALFVVDFEAVNRPIAAIPFAQDNERLSSHWATISEVLTSLGEHGAEKAKFLMAPNKGERLLALHKFASGGEVARVMLALKKALASGAETCVMVFDEIDTGISGKVADMVGRKMALLAKDFQVICISHLPQVAAYADTHFLISKSSKGRRTETTVTPLTRDKRVAELARLLAGADVTKSSLGAARDLIASAKT